MKKFLFKFPSRGRPEKFKYTLTEHLKHLSNENEYKFIFTFDENDLTMNNQEIVDFIEELNINHKIFYGNSQNKIEAINADLENETDFDVLMLIADDMYPNSFNYDKIIEEVIVNSDLGLDIVIHFNTARWANILDIWCVMGRTYYERFKYIYHPDYKSIFCDNEYTEVATFLNKRVFSEHSPFHHENISGDDTEVKNWQFNHEDWVTYEERKKLNYNL